jgi:Iron-containing redox enzyme
MTLPEPRGPLSERAVAALLGADDPGCSISLHDVDPLDDDDFHLALYLLYEVAYRGVDGVAATVEWDPRMLGIRRELETAFESAVHEAVAVEVGPEPVDVQLRAMIAHDDGASVSSFLAREGTEDMYREFLMHRSAYHLKEADPHSFGIPRLRGRAKVAMVEIQADEYGGGDAGWMHSALFATTMQTFGLDATEGAYVERLPGVTLATVNLMTLFALHRRLLGALVGHLAVFEMTSCVPNRRYADGLRRLGFDEATTRYFDEHVEADAVHESIAANDLAGSLVQDEPQLERDVLFGAAALLALDGRWADHVLGSWRRGESSLLTPIHAVSGV